MAQFYGILRGARGEATRTGTKQSGMEIVAASWEGAVEVNLWHDRETGTDMARVSLKPWEGRGTSEILYEGPVGGGE